MSLFGFRRAPQGPPAVSLAKGAEDNGLASMLADLVRQNVLDHAHKRSDFNRLLGRVAIVAEDAGVALTMVFSSGSLVVHSGIVGIPDVTIRADSEHIMDMSLVELTKRLHLPNLRGPVYKRVNAAMADGRIKVYGALFNAPMMFRLTRVMSVN